MIDNDKTYTYKSDSISGGKTIIHLWTILTLKFETKKIYNRNFRIENSF